MLSSMKFYTLFFTSHLSRVVLFSVPACSCLVELVQDVGTVRSENDRFPRSRPLAAGVIGDATAAKRYLHLGRGGESRSDGYGLPTETG